jgi:thioredoxin
MKSSIIFGLLFTFLFSHAAYAVEPGNKGEGDEHSEGGVIYLNKETFKQQVFDFETNKEWNYEGKVPAILDFYADWCGPCKMLAPVLNNIQKEYSGKIQVFKVDTDKEKELAAMFGITSLPTIVFIPVEGEPQAVMGFMPKEDLEKTITEVLKVNK